MFRKARLRKREPVPVGARRLRIMVAAIALAGGSTLVAGAPAAPVKFGGDFAAAAVPAVHEAANRG